MIRRLLTLIITTLPLCYCYSAQNEIPHHHDASRLLEKMHFKGNERVLDIGSGDGHVSAIIAKRLEKGSVIGVDISDVMVSFARRNFPKEKHRNLEFREGAAEKLVFKNEFDIIVSFAVLHWAHDHNKVIEKVRNSLKSNGFFAMSMPLGLPLKLQVAIESVMSDKAWRSFFSSFDSGLNFVSSDAYCALLEEGGFEVKEMTIETHENAFPNRRAFIGFVSQWLPYLRPLPMELKEAFLCEVVDHYLQLEPLDRCGQVKFEYSRLDLIAQKVSG